MEAGAFDFVGVNHHFSLLVLPVAPVLLGDGLVELLGLYGLRLGVDCNGSQTEDRHAG